MSIDTVLLHLNPSCIDVPEDRIRDVDPDKVKELAQSMREIGQLNAIEVLPGTVPGRYTLNAGAHRLAAAKEAPLLSIMATLFEGSADQRRLREIDENLYRAELTPYDQAAFLAERRVVYERVNGKIRPGSKAARQLGTNLSLTQQTSFFDDVTAKFGLPKKMISRALRRRNCISQEVWHRLRGHPVTKIASELDKLARLNEAEQRRVVRLMMQETRPAKSVSAALRAMSDAPVESPHDRQIRRLHEAWDKARPQAKQEFLQFLDKWQEVRRGEA